MDNLTKEQFEMAMANYSIANGYVWETWDIYGEWDRYKRNRSWCNEFFSSQEGAKYVE